MNDTLHSCVISLVLVIWAAIYTAILYFRKMMVHVDTNPAIKCYKDWLCRPSENHPSFLDNGVFAGNNNCYNPGFNNPPPKDNLQSTLFNPSPSLGNKPPLPITLQSQ